MIHRIGEIAIELDQIVFIAPYKGREIMRRVKMNRHKVLNLTGKKKTMSLMYTTNDQYILSPLTVEEIMKYKNNTSPN